jgi:hypothetical protein
VAGLVALVPVPFVDSVIGGRVLRVLLTDLAERHHLAMAPSCVAALAAAATSSPFSLASTGASVIRRIPVVGSLAAPLMLVRRADEALTLFATGALWDHYLEQHQPTRPVPAVAIDPAQARALGAIMARAMATARRQSLPRILRADVRGPYLAALIRAFDALYAEHT